MDIFIHDSVWQKGAFKYYFKFIANFTNHTIGFLKPIKVL
jgi:hypothetical protein